MLKVSRIPQETIDRINDNADIVDIVSKSVDLMINCKGTLVISGVGKSGSIGKKIAATLVSLGTPSIFLHTSDAFHLSLIHISEPRDS